LIDALTQVALDLSGQLPNGHVEIRLAGQDPQLLYVEEQPAEPVAAGEDGMAARITLRLPESLKAAIETAAETEGVSVNTWLVRALQRAVSGVGVPGRAQRSDKRITGFAQS
jgi:predicted DNA binding CopG/RHH family protein